MIVSRMSRLLITLMAVIFSTGSIRAQADTMFIMRVENSLRSKMPGVLGSEKDAEKLLRDFNSITPAQKQFDTYELLLNNSKITKFGILKIEMQQHLDALKKVLGKK